MRARSRRSPRAAFSFQPFGSVSRWPVVRARRQGIGSRFRHRATDFDFLVEEGVIDRADRDLCTIVDSAAAVGVLQDFYEGVPPA